MTLAVIDSSIAVKWIVGEDDSDLALRLRRLYRFAAPELLTAEAANPILNKFKRGHLTEPEAYAAAELVSQLAIEFYPLQPLAEEATAMAINLRHPVYDCMFLALAAKLDCPVISADSRVVALARGLSIVGMTMQQAIDDALT
jgi:predicted nucleic acid-binding protein